MPVNGPTKGPSPLTPETGALIKRPAMDVVPQRSVATTRGGQAAGPPPRRPATQPSTQPSTQGPRAPLSALPARAGAMSTPPQAPDPGETWDKMAKSVEKVNEQAHKLQDALIQNMNHASESVSQAAAGPPQG